MPKPASIPKIPSHQTRQEALDCPACGGRGERLLFDPDTGVDYHGCDACQETGYNLLGLLMRGLLNPPESENAPQTLKETLKKPKKARKQQVTEPHPF